MIAAFLGGMLSFCSPCVLPLVPGYLSLMTGMGTAQASLAASASPGRGAAAAVAEAADTRRVLRATLLFVAGFTVVFTALGATASALGQAVLDHRLVLERVSGLVIIAMGLILAGLVAPVALLRERRFQVSPARLGAFAPPVMGMAFAFGWTPCIGPVLATVLTAAAAQATLERGVALLVAYSLGLGVPFVLVGVAAGRLSGVVGWVRRRARVINLVAGLMLVGFGLLLLTNRVGRVSAALIDWMDRVGLDFLVQI